MKIFLALLVAIAFFSCNTTTVKEENANVKVNDVSQKEKDMMQLLKHTLYLVNSDGYPTQIDSLKKYCKASAEVVYVHGTGHYPMIEKPAEFNAALEKVFGMIGKK
ncbi:MAG TPA: alpha/beta hydrolase [Chitinophagaceae bacterium]|nr:alpha/beta hydrolase [Chitinophagaceae bacterium]